MTFGQNYFSATSAQRRDSLTGQYRGGHLMHLALRWLHRWHNHIRKTDITPFIGLPEIMDLIVRRRNILLGHAARLGDNTSVHQALRRQIDISFGSSQETSSGSCKKQVAGSDSIWQQFPTRWTANLSRCVVHRGHYGVKQQSQLPDCATMTTTEISISLRHVSYRTPLHAVTHKKIRRQNAQRQTWWDEKWRGQWRHHASIFTLNLRHFTAQCSIPTQPHHKHKWAVQYINRTNASHDGLQVSSLEPPS